MCLHQCCSIIIIHVSFIQRKVFLFEVKTKKFYVKWRQSPLVVFYYCVLPFMELFSSFGTFIVILYVQ